MQAFGALLSVYMMVNLTDDLFMSKRYDKSCLPIPLLCESDLVSLAKNLPLHFSWKSWSLWRTTAKGGIVRGSGISNRYVHVYVRRSHWLNLVTRLAWIKIIKCVVVSCSSPLSLFFIMRSVMNQISPDPTLTVENVTDVMERVTMDKRRQLWGRMLPCEEYFLQQRGRPRLRRRTLLLGPKPPNLKILGEIYSSHSSEKKRTHACSDVYANCRPESSWEHLTSLLYEEDEMTAVDQARPFLPPRGKLTTNKQCLLLWHGTWLQR